MRAASIVLRKDLRVLWRSPLLLGALLAYPIVIALLVGLIAGYASSKPRVAFVDEAHLPPVVAVAGHRFHLQTVIDEVAGQVTLVRLSPKEAARELANGKVVATITVPPGFLGSLQTMATSPSLVLRTGSGGLSGRVTQQMQSLVYQLNQKLQAGYIAANLEFVRLILHGGSGKFLGRHFTLLGLDGTQQELAKLPPSKRVAVIEHFVQVARVGLAQTGTALKATANPITLTQPKTHGRTWVLSAQVQAYGIAVTVTFLALLLAAGAAAAEKDEGTIGRLRRGLVSFGQLVWAKSRSPAWSGSALGAAIALVFGVVVEIGGVTGGEPWARLPLLFVGVALVGGVVGAVGVAARRARAGGADGVAAGGARRAAGRLPRASSRAAPSRPRTGSACSCRSPTRCAGSAPPSTTRIRGGRSRSRRSGSSGSASPSGCSRASAMRRLAA